MLVIWYAILFKVFTFLRQGIIAVNKYYACISSVCGSFKDDKITSNSIADNLCKFLFLYITVKQMRAK